MTVSRAQPGRTPATIANRAVARSLDLQVMTFCGFAVFAFTFLYFGDSPIHLSEEWEFTSAIWAGIVAAVVAEFLMLGFKGATFGKVIVGIALVESRRPMTGARRGRLVMRFVLVVVGCGLAFMVSVTVAGASVSRLSEAQLLIHLIVSLAGTWLFSLLSAFTNGNRRGWHDVLAGTVLVSASESSVLSGTGGACRGDGS